jgi:stalled ribosome rescue protein Dom34
MSHYHAVVWIDHQKATSWQFTADEQQKTMVEAQDQHQRVHRRGSAHGGHKAAADHDFFDEVAKSLAGAKEVLVIGPAQTKAEFATYLKEKHPLVAQYIVAVESADHPSESEVLDHARKHFKSIDRMLAQPVFRHAP